MEAFILHFPMGFLFPVPIFFITRPLPLTLHSAPLLLYRGSHLTSELPAASGPQFYSSHFFPLSGVPRPSTSHPNSFLSLRFLSSRYWFLGSSGSPSKLTPPPRLRFSPCPISPFPPQLPEAFSPQLHRIPFLTHTSSLHLRSLSGP